MPLSPQQADFVEKFLGVSLNELAESVTSSGSAPLATWQNAVRAAQKTVDDLRSTLSGYGHPGLERVAKLALTGVAESNQSQLNAALVAYSDAAVDAREAATRQVASQVSAFRQYLSSDAVIALCEDNPFGVNVDIRGPLGGALDQIERAVAD